MFKILARPALLTFSFSRAPLHSTQVFHELSNKQIADPQKMRALIRKRIAFHSRMSQTNLYHKKRVRHAVKSCFSEKKTKRFKRVRKISEKFPSEILQQKLRLTVSSKAFRTIKKMGSIDNYILCTKPKDLDSKQGEYLRTIMLRKVNDPEYRVPYILGTNRKPKIKKYHSYMAHKKANEFVVPKEFKKKLMTFQKRFGSSVEQLSNEDYKKYLELEKLKRTMGSQIEPNHPLVLELDRKLKDQITPEEQERLDEISRKAEQEYLNHPTNNAMRRATFEKEKRDEEAAELKIKEAFIKYHSVREEL